VPVEAGGSIDSLLTAAAERHPDRRALSSSPGSVTYAELDAGVDELTRRLAALAGTGERVAVIGPNVPALVAGMFAAWRAGALAVPLSARLREYELTGILHDAQPAAVVTVASYRAYSFVDLLERLRPELHGFRGALVVDELGAVVDGVGGGPESDEGEAVAPGTAALLYTSGTTGRPKGALVAHARELGVASELADVLALTPNDACAQVLPVAHAFGLNCLVAAFAAGASVVLGDSAATIRPLVAAVTEHEATVLHGSPALFLSLLKAVPDGLPSVRRGFVGGAASPPGLVERLEGVGMTALNLYGMTEIAAAACCRPDDPPEVRYTSAGRPLPGFEWRVELSDAAAQGAGELLVRGPWVTSGYFRRPEETDAAFVDGWFRTGDIGGFDDGGHLTISGRIKEVVQVAGFSVFPAEIEGFLLTHPDVAQAAVVGAPHAQMGEVLQAFVVPRESADVTPASLLQFARGKIADYKLPYGIRVVDELPLLASGKPDRLALAARVAEEATAGSTA
jgi:acyl-CoA synthetase (AMP-forming)/AMP-acid ligase II